MKKCLFALCLFALCFSLRAPAASAEEGRTLYVATLTQSGASQFNRKINERLDWIVSFSSKLGWGYKRPTLPEIWLVSRAYMLRHAEEICQTPSKEESRECVKNKFAWTDDERAIYILRQEDVATHPALREITAFPAELWIEMVTTHELAHLAQLEASSYRINNLPCLKFVEWERQANMIARQWLHSLQSVEAERLNVLFRESSYHGVCTS